MATSDRMIPKGLSLPISMVEELERRARNQGVNFSTYVRSVLESAIHSQSSEGSSGIREHAASNTEVDLLRFFRQAVRSANSYPLGEIPFAEAVAEDPAPYGQKKPQAQSGSIRPATPILKPPATG